MNAKSYVGVQARAIVAIEAVVGSNVCQFKRNQHTSRL